MKTYKTALYILLMLMGTSLSGYSQGITNGGFITANGGSYLTLDGSNFTLTSSTANQFTLDNLVVNKYTSLKEDSYLTVNTSLVMNDTLCLKATSGNNASLITNGTVSGAGIAEQYLIADQWHMVSPMVSSSVSGVYTGAYLYDWNEVDSILHWISVTYKNLNVGQGYFAYSLSSLPSPTTFYFDGTFNTGNVSPTITYTSGIGKGKGWNMCGNPYPSSLRWDNTWTKTNVDATVYVWDGAAGNYVNYNYTTGLGGLSNGDIMPGQGFWIKANASSPSMTIPNNKRLHTTNSFLKSASGIENILEMTISDQKRHDYCVLKLDPLGSNSFDATYDAYKLFGLPEAPAIYLIKEKEIASTSYFPEEYENQSISLGFYAGKSGEQKISFDNIDSFDENVLIYLLDKEDGSYTLLNENPNYTFVAQIGRNDTRFEIHFTTSPLEVEESIEESNKIKIYTYEDKLYLRNNSTEKVLFTVVSLLGQPLTQLELEANSSIIKPLNIKAQTLIVQAKSKNLSKVEKVSLH